MELSHLRRFSAPIWAVLIGTLLTRASFFMVWPYMAVMLHRNFGLSEIEIGIIMSMAALGGAVVALYVGYLSDKLGRKNLLILSCLAHVATFMILAEADQSWLYAAGALMAGVSRAMLEPPARAMISDLLPEIPVREMAHQVRYYCINLGAAFGPLLGLQLGFTGVQSSFYLVALAYLIYGICFVIAFWRIRNVQQPPKNNQNFSQTLRVLANDKAFMMLIVANTLVMYAYLHQETSLVQYLNVLGDRVVPLFTSMITVNAGVIVLLQFPVLKLLNAWSLYQRVYLGVALFTAAFVMYGWIPLDAPEWYWLAATFVLSVGEVVLFPTFNLLIDRAAPDHLRGAYFGAGNLTSIGVSLAPFAGGVILSWFGGPALFLSTAVVLCFAGYLYTCSARHHQKTQTVQAA
ncbi:MFS transporter [Photobacterium sp. 1_MG-2023]|uniref:MDR family MFS transporter n=1 Tax=Photobacterium sp. 1_MG-2023 TaxID=3062646 RepID=UPI0026E16B05|nr:MFS transporter [Photobacterium sp. 1_MG-2023]MDO6708693.1 MFS transporter [Photobacterium sp. 1_MG-2023]